MGAAGRGVEEFENCLPRTRCQASACGQVDLAFALALALALALFVVAPCPLWSRGAIENRALLTPRLDLSCGPGVRKGLLLVGSGRAFSDLVPLTLVPVGTATVPAVGLRIGLATTGFDEEALRPGAETNVSLDLATRFKK